MTSCIFCETALVSWLFQPLDPKKNAASRFDHFVRCPKCGYGVMAKRPSSEDIPGFYDLQKYYTQSASHIAPVTPSITDRILTKIAYWADRSEQMTPLSFRSRLSDGAYTLDVGCGDGAKVDGFSAIGCIAYGLEPDPRGQAQGRERIVVGAAESIPENLRSIGFDLVSMTHVLEHCIEPDVALQNLFDILKPGGVFWCEVPNSDCVYFEELNISSEMFDAPRHIHFFGKESLVRIFEGTGFKIERFYYTGFTRHHSPSWRAWEREIRRNTLRLAPSADPPDHTFARSCNILARSLFASPERKYDCIGLIARKPV